MGQYYRSYLVDPNSSETKVFNSSGHAKLIGHSWICNAFVNTAYLSIRNRPMHVAWIGDYTDEYPEDSCWARECGLSREEFLYHYNAVLEK